MSMNSDSTVDRLQEILGQLDADTIIAAIRQRGLLNPTPPETVIAYSIIESARSIQRALADRSAGAALVGDGITLACPSQVTLHADAEGSDREYDLPGGQNAAQVKQAAITNAEIDAREKVAKELNRQIELIACEPLCKKTVGAANITIRGGTGHITAENWVKIGIDWYEAEAIADGTVTVKCEV